MFSKWFKKKKPPPEPKYDSDISIIAKEITPIIESVAQDIFHHHMDFLLTRPSSYIVPVVWASEETIGMDPIAQDIYRRIEPAMESVFRALDLEHPNSSQLYGISYLVRGMIISKVAFMVEAFKNMTTSIERNALATLYNLKETQTIGTA